MKQIILGLFLLVALFVVPVKAHAVTPFVPAPYTEPVSIECVEGEPSIVDNQKFSRQEKIIVFLNVSYRWHITNETESEVTYQLQVDVNPTQNETWVNVNGQTRTLEVPDCSEEVEPEVVVSTGGGNPPTFPGSTTEAPAVCTNDSIGKVGGIYVSTETPNDGKLLVRWWPPVNADKAHIIYTELDGNDGDWKHALLNTQNDGVEEISLLKNGGKYVFAVAGVNGCAVGKWSATFAAQP